MIKNQRIFFQNFIKLSITQFYEQLLKDADYWKHYIRSETIAIVSDIWNDAKNEIQFFLNDLQ